MRTPKIASRSFVSNSKNGSRRNLAWLGAASTIALTWSAGPALAQDVDSGSTAAAADSGMIVVTAQRREELSRDVPVTVTTVTDQQLTAANVESLISLPKLSPGLRMDQQGGYTQPVIRGIGNTIAGTKAGNSVAIYVDGFYVPNSLAIDFDFLNVESVQVLKGPQGTLFGRNSTGGAILVKTVEPESETRGIVQASYERFNAKKVQGYFTTPLSDKAAFSVEGLYGAGDGFQKNIYNGPVDPGVKVKHPGTYEKWTVRATLKADLSDAVTFLLRYEHADKQDPLGVLFGTMFGTVDGATYPFSGGDRFPGTVFASKPGDVALNQRTDLRIKTNTIQLTGRIDLGSAELTSYTQYRKENIAQLLDADYSSASILALNLPEKDEVVTQEFLVNSKSGSKLQYTVGVFYYGGKTKSLIDLSYFGSPYFQLSGNGTKMRTYAAYGDMTYEITDNLFLTGGLRFSHDEVKDAYALASGVPVFAPDFKDDKLAPRAVIRYKPSENSSIYTSFTKGFKSAFPTPLKENRTNYKDKYYIRAEDINSYEAGYKYGDRYLSIELAGFYYDYKHLQNAFYELGSSIYSSADKVKVKGLEGAVRYQVTPKLQVSAAGTYLDAKYKKYDVAGYFTPAVVPDSDGDGIPDFAGFGTSVQANVSGMQMARAPKFSGTLAGRYTTEFARGELVVSANLYHTSKVFFDPAHQFSQGSYDIVAARVQWTDPTDTYTVAVFGDNLLDKEYVTQANVGLVAAGSNWGKPVTYGVSLRMKFGAD